MVPVSGFWIVQEAWHPPRGNVGPCARPGCVPPLVRRPAAGPSLCVKRGLDLDLDCASSVPASGVLPPFFTALPTEWVLRSETRRFGEMGF